MQGIKSGVRKREIEVLRIWCTIAVCLHHLRYCSETLPYGGGYIAVDFFFIVSGFYLRKYFVTRNGTSGNDVCKYIGKRYVRLIKDFIPAFTIALIVNIIYFDYNPISNLFLYIKEGLMIEIGCIDSALRINPPDWYCGYLIIASGLTYMILKYFKRRVITCSLLVTFVTYAILWGLYGHINIFPIQSCFISTALARAVAGQMLGVFLYELMNWNSQKFVLSQRFIRISFVVLLMIVSYMLFWDTAYRGSDYICVILLAVLFYLSQFVQFGVLLHVDCRIWNVLSELTYIVFLNHYIIVKMFGYYNVFQYMDWKIASILYLIIVVVFSIIMLQIRINIERLFLRIRSYGSDIN